MKKYVDVFVVPVPKNKVDAYRKDTETTGKVCRAHGALEYIVCIGDDIKTGKVTSFPQAVKHEPGETVVVIWVSYKSRAHRDEVNAAVMKDLKMAELMDPKHMPFDAKRMFMGGFEVMVEV